MEANILKKMSQATEKINRVAKNLKVGVGQSSYKAVGEADVLDAVKPVEAELGIYSYPISREIVREEIFTTTSSYEDRDTGNVKTTEKTTLFLRIKTIYRFVNVDNPTDYVDITSYGDGVDPQDKAPGKAMTYSDKYALLKAYKIETGEDPDQKHSEDVGKKVAKDAPKKETPVIAPNAKQIERLMELGGTLGHVATYYKTTVDQVTAAQVQNLISSKERMLSKQSEAKNEE